MDGAPNLGGHNRSGESIKATKAKQKMQQLQADSNAAPLALRAGPASGNVAQAPDANTLHSSMAIPHEAAWGQAPLLVRVGPMSITSSNVNAMVFCRKSRSCSARHVQGQVVFYRTFCPVKTVACIVQAGCGRAASTLLNVLGPGPPCLRHLHCLRTKITCVA